MYIFEDNTQQPTMMHHKLTSKKMDYSHCPLKKRPVHYVKSEIKEEMDFDNKDECLEPENLSTKPQDLSVRCKTAAVAPLAAKKEPSSPSCEHHPNAAVPLSSPYYGHPDHQQQQEQHHRLQQQPFQPTAVKAGPLEPLCLNIAGAHHPAAAQTAVAAYHHNNNNRHYAPATPRPVPAQYPNTGYLAGFMYHPPGTDGRVSAMLTAYPPTVMAIARDASLSPPAARTGSAFKPLLQHTLPATAAVAPVRSPPPAVHLNWYGRHSVSSSWSPSSAEVDSSSLPPPSSASSSSAMSPSYGQPPPQHQHQYQLQQQQQQQYSGGESDASTVSGIKRESPSSSARYKCVACSKTYSTISGMTKHQQYHCTNDESHCVTKTFCCKYCDKAYNTLGALKMHIRTHTLPCICNMCGKAFSRPWLLQGHIRTHTGEKPFSCQHCNRAFADRSNLRAHLQTHSDVKKYSCATCSKTFSRMSLLTKHCDTGCPRMLQQSHQQQQQQQTVV